MNQFGSTKILCTLCARGGSKGFPGKNIAKLLDKPLLIYTLEQAKQVNVFDAIALSSDCDAILKCGKKEELDYLIKRPSKFSEDTSSKLDAIKHCVLEVEKRSNKTYDILVDLDVTAPLRTAQDILGAIDLLRCSGSSNVITGCRSRRSPYFNLVELKEDNSVKLSKQYSRKIVRRQDAPICYDMNASIYVWRRDVFLCDPNLFYSDTKLFEMPMERSIDIDSPLDFLLVESLMRKNVQEKNVCEHI